MLDLPDIKTLNQLFELRDGVLYWKARPAISITVGAPAGSVSNRGYLRTGFGGKIYLNHRLIFLMHHGWCPAAIDHIDGNPLNNRPDNLRPATKSQNACNTGVSAANTSGHKGARLDKRNGRWYAQIKRHGRNMHLGYFDTPEEAVLARTMAAADLHGEFARSV